MFCWCFSTNWIWCLEFEVGLWVLQGKEMKTILGVQSHQTPADSLEWVLDADGSLRLPEAKGTQEGLVYPSFSSRLTSGATHFDKWNSTLIKTYSSGKQGSHCQQRQEVTILVTVLYRNPSCGSWRLSLFHACHVFLDRLVLLECLDLVRKRCLRLIITLYNFWYWLVVLCSSKGFLAMFTDNERLFGIPDKEHVPVMQSVFHCPESTEKHFRYLCTRHSPSNLFFIIVVQECRSCCHFAHFMRNPSSPVVASFILVVDSII